MKEISLTRNMVALVDDSDFEEISKHKWCVKLCCGKWYAYRGVRVNGKVKHILMHRQILGSACEGVQVDHADHDTLNNQRSNLRACSPSQNQGNQKYRQYHKSSEYKGVAWSEATKKWKAQIRIDGKLLYLGVYVSEKDAAVAYNEAAKQHHGEFAYLNVV